MASSPATRALLKTSSRRHLNEIEDLSPEGHLRICPHPSSCCTAKPITFSQRRRRFGWLVSYDLACYRLHLVSPVLWHLDMAKTPGVLDQLRLVHFMALVLRAAER